MAQATLARAPARPARAWISSTRAEAVGLVLLVVAAALVRWPYLWMIPQFTDGAVESLRSFAVYQGRLLPLTNVAAYIGALHNYVEAAGFWAFGPSVYTPRLLAWLLGSLTVGATYLLAREMVEPGARKTTAWLAAGLMVTNGVHVGGTSHVAWSHSLTPLFLTPALLLLYRAVERRDGRSLLGAGLASGLALQTHPTVVAFLPGMAAYLLWRGWVRAHGRAPLQQAPLLRTRWPWLALGLFLLAYGNVIAYNATSGLGSIRSALDRDAGYAESRGEEADSYAEKLGHVVTTLVRLPAGAVDARTGVADYLADPVVLAYAGLTAAGLALLARGGNPLPALVVLSAVLVFPLFNARHDLLPRQGRYLAPLLPVLLAALAAAAWALGGAIRRRLMSRAASERLGAGLGLMASALLVLLPLVPLERYYAQSVADGETNDRFFALLAEIEAARSNGESVLLDYGLSNERLGGGGTGLRAMNFLLTVRGVPHDDLTLDPDRVARRYPGGGIVVVLTGRTYRAVGQRLALEPPPGRSALTPPNPYGVYRLGPARVGAGAMDDGRATTDALLVASAGGSGPPTAREDAGD